MGSNPSKSTNQPPTKAVPAVELPKYQRIKNAIQFKEDLSEFSIADLACFKQNNPEPAISKRKKEDIFHASKYTKTDDNIRNVPINALKCGMREFVDRLLDGTADDILAKVRAIYYFIASVDVSQIKMDSDNPPPSKSPLEYLLKIEENKGSPAFLFSALCKVAQIPCEIISGVNKSAAYALGKPVDTHKMAAQWNAVYIDGEWRFIDCFWSSTCMSGAGDNDEWDIFNMDGRTVTGKKISGDTRIIHHINEFFFLTDPDKLIATHLPKENCWQLLEKQITLNEFAASAYRRERFFELGIRLTNKELNSCVLHPHDGSVSIEMAVPEDSPSIDFKYMLYAAKNVADAEKLNKCVFFQRSTGSLKYTITIPIRGKFKMDIFAKDSRKHKSMDLICSYLIDCTHVPSQQEPLPDDPKIGWGPDTGYLAAFDMEAVSHKQGIIETDSGIIDITFKMAQPLEVMHLMLSNSHNEQELKKCSIIEVLDGTLHAHIRLPSAGTYAFKLFANEEGLPGELQNICNYVIKCHKRVTNEGFPYVPNGKIGMFTACKSLGIATIDPRVPTIVTNTSTARVVIDVPQGTELFAEMFHSELNFERANSQVKVTFSASKITFNLELLATGRHALAIYAKKADDQQVFNVFNYMIENQQEVPNKGGIKHDGAPMFETIRAQNGATELVAGHLTKAKVVAELMKELAYMEAGKNQISATQEGATCKLSVKLPGDGRYELRLFEKTQNGATLEIKNRYLVIHEGGVPLAKNQVLPREPEKDLEDQEEEVEEDVDPMLETTELEEFEGLTQEEIVKKQTEVQRVKDYNGQLQLAIKSEDEETLSKAISAFEKEKIPDRYRLCVKAKRMVAIIAARRELRQAMEQEDLASLQEAIARAYRVKHQHQLDIDIRKAEKMLEAARRVENLRGGVLKLDRRTISEINSFSHPPPEILSVMQATLLLLGSNKKDITTWNQTLIQMGKTGKESLKRRVMEFKVSDLKPPVVEQAKEIFDQFTQPQVMAVSSGAAAFYIWATGMIAEAEIATGDKTTAST